MNNHEYSILVIDDDQEMRDSLKQLLQSAGFDITTAVSARKALDILDGREFDALICDVRMPEMDGLAFLSEIKPRVASPVVMMSAHGDIPMAVDALQRGAYSFVEKPFDPRQLINTLSNVVKHHRLLERQERLQSRLSELSGLDKILIGESATIQSAKREILDISASEANVLIVGETGTGKELAARAIHDLSARSGEPFIIVNCAALAPSGFEAAMFGMGDGQPGFFERAHLGTLFLDEINSIPYDLQGRILRVIETGEFMRVGLTNAQKVDVRVLSASNQLLEGCVSEGVFRSDLYYRLNTMEINLPSLRSRMDDIDILFSHFVQHFAATYNIEPPSNSSDDLALLMGHDWPGNVRELQSVAERRVLTARRGMGSVRDALNINDDIEIPENLRGAVAAFESKLIGKALMQHNGRMDNVADALGISRRTLNEKIVKLGLDKDKVLNS